MGDVQQNPEPQRVRLTRSMLTEMQEALDAQDWHCHSPDEEWDEGRRIACTVSETSPASGGLIYLLGCASCLIAAHAWAMQGIECPWEHYGATEGSLADDVNAVIREAGLSLPLVPAAPLSETPEGEEGGEG